MRTYENTLAEREKLIKCETTGSVAWVELQFRMDVAHNAEEFEG